MIIISLRSSFCNPVGQFMRPDSTPYLITNMGIDGIQNSNIQRTKIFQNTDVHTRYFNLPASIACVHEQSDPDILETVVIFHRGRLQNRKCDFHRYGSSRRIESKLFQKFFAALNHSLLPLPAHIFEPVLDHSRGLFQRATDELRDECSELTRGVNSLPHSSSDFLYGPCLVFHCALLGTADFNIELRTFKDC